MTERIINPVTAEELVDRAKQYLQNGYRLIQICCTKTPSEMYLLYSFEKLDLTLENLRLDVQSGDTIPSISDVYFAAFLYENEIHDLYGINVSGMAVDFQGTFYETAVKQPFNITAADMKE
ncbi:Energy-conserving hydrogenase (ferredoxin), subunit D [Dehalobacter sp. UNSWDHB]|jgi:NADH:ubiquinone oxidoreductase 27 kD subunit|uniref:NADH-quinone oxidoreductase subunit C n=1 Tax=unclassified Dehalobacter TaxID=2635733 RepID=UPI00028B7C28|nr:MULTISPECIES: NADH-quinone oxidoreductase subunit C [unclassified Dehalobacter]AFV01810.1 Energy-conserving hydrogenase (ferredoxin), subunit D [Dehalobacter sp. DCA]AFV04846.1 Energy-conserving hydrogenase (ferredoxin), subunit D [Dehalobacter sp. CF]EQB21612.1 Energy-conserving hydrogenase (ferredoxin), subunit D [Dehalobacter sp. UNSWDHB]